MYLNMIKEIQTTPIGRRSQGLSLSKQRRKLKQIVNRLGRFPRRSRGTIDFDTLLYGFKFLVEINVSDTYSLHQALCIRFINRCDCNVVHHMRQVVQWLMHEHECISMLRSPSVSDVYIVHMYTTNL